MQHHWQPPVCHMQSQGVQALLACSDLFLHAAVVCGLQDSASIADAELQRLGITLQGKDIWYGEFGIGGGTSQYCNKLAETPVEVRLLMTQAGCGASSDCRFACLQIARVLGTAISAQPQDAVMFWAGGPAGTVD